jgi:peptide/nickel transport system permease protein
VVFLLQRIFFYAVAFWVALTANFALPRLTGQSPADGIIQQNRAYYEQHPEAIEALYRQYGRGDFTLSDLVTQYPGYIKDMLTLNFGVSVSNSGQPVIDVIKQTLPFSILLVGTSVFLACLIGTFIGMFCAWRRNGVVDTLAPPFFIAIGAFPSFFVALLAIYLICTGQGPGGLSLFPSSLSYDQTLSPGWDWEFISSVIRHAELPILMLTILTIGGWILIMRNVMINNVDEDYITMGRAKGVRDWRLMTWYAGRNSILPTLTAFAGSLGFAVTGSILIESTMNYQGMGYKLAQASFGGDFPLAQACLLVVVLCVLGANFIMDSIYVLLDPRTRVN